MAIRPHHLPGILLAVFVLPTPEMLRVLPGARAAQECVRSAERMQDAHGADVQRLRNDLLCDYDRLVVKPGTDVQINAYIYRLHLDVHRGILQMLVDLGWSWNDPRLRWEPTGYSDVSEVVFSDREIWVPDLEALNSLQREFEELRCRVTSMGNVSCNPVFNLQTTCGNSARRWPLDEHECVFELSSRNHDSREYRISVELNSTELYVADDASHEWVVVEAKQIPRETSQPGFQFSRLEMHLKLRRNKQVHVLTVGVPTLVLPCLVLAQLWVDPRWPGRLLLGLTSVACLCMYLQCLSETVPDDTDGSAPLVILFYRNSLVIATLVVLLTIALRNLSERRDTPPPWLSGGSSWLLQRARPVTGMLLEEEEDDDDDNNEQADVSQVAVEAGSAVDRQEAGVVKPMTWRKIARLTDGIAFVALLLTFAILLFAEVPS
ncbi:acetylcholine receptor subunit beta [Frankliniella occidentalis]|uniref:Acetylcholine receptor subunit beta n=1 Tax=Frankliniella occidentalis TaxID=133901 RepID=A0A6J1TFB4_FRAOC|nr:acetylcholine receptor subunit beta [Frankliniella occidentalis]